MLSPFAVISSPEPRRLNRFRRHSEEQYVWRLSRGVNSLPHVGQVRIMLASSDLRASRRRHRSTSLAHASEQDFWLDLRGVNSFLHPGQIFGSKVFGLYFALSQQWREQ